MQNLEFQGIIGVKRINVRIWQASFGGGGYQILIDNYLHGTMRKIEGSWIASINRGSFLTAEDISILGDAIDAENKI